VEVAVAVKLLGAGKVTGSAFAVIGVKAYRLITTIIVSRADTSLFVLVLVFMPLPQ